MHRHSCSFVAWLLSLLLTGCLEFDAQDLTIVHDAKADRIDVHVVYRGLHCERVIGLGEDPLAKALTDLASARDAGFVCIGRNWPLQFDPTRVVQGPAATLLARIDVENGSLFTDADGVLCAQQFVRIREARAFLQQLDTLVALGLPKLLEQPVGEGGTQHEFDDTTRELLTEFLRGGQRLLQVEPGRIEIRLPCSDRDHRWAKDQLFEGLVEQLMGELRPRLVADGKAVPAEPVMIAACRTSPTFRFFADNEWSLVREPGLTRLALGVKGADLLPIRIAAGGDYDDTLLRELRQRGEPIDERLGADELERRFTAFRGRDAVLPPRLAERR